MVWTDTSSHPYCTHSFTLLHHNEFTHTHSILSRKKSEKKSTPYIHFLRDGLISYDFWGHPGHRTRKGHFCALISQLLRRAKIRDLHQVIMGNQHTKSRETRQDGMWGILCRISTALSNILSYVHQEMCVSVFMNNTVCLVSINQ